MIQLENASAKKISNFYSLILLITGFSSFIFISPKWLFPICAWTGPAALLLFYHFSDFKRKFLWVLSVLVISQIIAFYEVVPIPGAGLIIFVLLNSIFKSLPFVLDKVITKKSNSFWATLIFPITYTAFEFISSFGPWGAWSSIVNTQFEFSWLNQLASVTGIWGISFLVYWFASYTGWLVNLLMVKKPFGKTAFVFPSILFIVLTTGAIRYYGNDQSSNSVKVAGITVNTIPFLEALYKDVNRKSIHIDPASSPVSPDLQQAQLSLIPFIEHPDSTKFKITLQTLSNIYDSLFALSKKAADQGAKIIEWSEGSVITWKGNERSFITRSQNFAKENNVDLLIAMASIETGKITSGKKFMENKAVYIDHNGIIQNTLFKNKPVPGIEPSKPGDGVIPLIKTDYGNISTSICYDADFPSLMQQLGKQKSGLLLLPSGDWKAISPYHSNAAVYRAIENGNSIFRQVNGGLSIAADYRGKIIASHDYFTPEEKLLIADIPITHVNTIYNIIGDAFGYACLYAFLTTVIALFVKWIISKFRRKKTIMSPAV
ncbi:hypothetical protein FRZ67_07790 [Panacibacter ginsenosidivorans]|uniref:CN hydrolase domain-containing protein n=1 Tax=Panacibacter ginsenosidivorans TaxID=1813871 RepID=A0A5B8V6U4_9BACT|nr:nitrilase-related carbon-nitrogen hydrolase [Panacibacter ginsenosidivorans]QEC67200.1 hypothetical protein FRZ67_07790 [Panacibacter ginsenosidivorans]